MKGQRGHATQSPQYIGRAFRSPRACRDKSEARGTRSTVASTAAAARAGRGESPVGCGGSRGRGSAGDAHAALGALLPLPKHAHRERRRAAAAAPCSRRQSRARGRADAKRRDPAAAADRLRAAGEMRSAHDAAGGCGARAASAAHICGIVGRCGRARTQSTQTSLLHEAQRRGCAGCPPPTRRRARCRSTGSRPCSRSSRAGRTATAAALVHVEGYIDGLLTTSRHVWAEQSAQPHQHLTGRPVASPSRS